MNTWTEKGQGRKKCQSPTCPLYVPVRSAQCTCGYTFESKAKEPKEPKASTEPKPRKLEKPVETSSGDEVIRKNKFVTTVKGAEEATTSTQKVVRAKHELLIPAGNCPVELPGISQDAIEAWVVACRKREPIYYLGYTCFAYWLATIYERSSGTYKMAIDVLQRLMMAEAGRYVGQAETQPPTYTVPSPEPLSVATQTIDLSSGKGIASMLRQTGMIPDTHDVENTEELSEE